MEKSEFVRTNFIITNKWTNRVNYNVLKNTSSTLNIPQRLVPYLEERAGTSNQLRMYLHSLLDKYRFICYSGNLPGHRGVKTKFQDKGQSVQRKDFRPFNGDWAELKIIAAMHNSSATYIFVLLLELDAGESGEVMAKVMKGVVPTDLLEHPIAFTQTLYRNRSILRKYSRFGNSFYYFDRMQKSYPG
ncbi:MAG: DUF1564 domain-containing protein [Leptospira sp.]|nr:DUF1564 domain-containing protein [Leptospira sp.]